MIASKDGKNLYICPHCSQKCKGKQALAAHITKRHKGEKGQAANKIVRFIQNEKTLSGMLKAVAKQLETGGDIQFSEEFTQELRIQDAKMQLAIRLLAYDKIKKTLQTSAQISKISDTIAERFGKDIDLEKTPIQVLMRIRESLDRGLDRDMQFLREVSGFRPSENDDGVILEFIHAITQMHRDVNGKNENEKKPSSLGIIPSDPQERENVRRILQLPKGKVG